MKLGKQQIAIAEVCGLRLFVLHKPIHDPFGYYRENACGYTGNINEAWRVTREVGQRYTFGKSDQPDRVVLEPAPLPDYLHDLNAMHEAEKTLSGDQTSCYHDFLYVVIADEMDRKNAPPFADACERSYAMVHATAAQRAEAFLRTIGRWDDNE